jgi:CheY-like chemotaxis protein
MRILLVEDIDDNREVMRTMLEMLGHEVIETANGKEGIKAALKQSPDLVLMDLSMPEVDGFQATAAIRSFPAGQIPIIAVTAYPQSYWRDKAEAAGCDEYLQKPVTTERLSAVLNEFLPKSDT